MFKVQSVEEVKQNIRKYASNLARRTMIVPLEESIGCQLAKDVVSNEDLPHFDRSTVDGYAVKHQVVQHASSTTPLLLELLGKVEMGKASTISVTDIGTVYVPTGGALPEGADAVVMVEYCEELGQEIVVQGNVSKWENVLRVGSDIRKGESFLNQGDIITTRSIGLLSACGVTEVEVYQPITCMVISTGDEIVSPDKQPHIGEVRDINSLTVKAHLVNEGFRVEKSIVLSDNFELYKQEVLKGFKHYDIVVSSGGSSVGEKDYTERVLQDVGANIFTHGMNIKPGKPTILAEYMNQLFIGLPGQPTSAFIVLQEVIHALKEGIQGQRITRPSISCILMSNVHAAPGKQTYQLVQVKDNGAIPIFTKSGMISGLAKANGYIVVSEDMEGLSKGEAVEVYQL